MVLVSTLYDTRKEKYAIYHTGILAFIITIGVPLNFGITKLPFLDVLLLFVGGFFSLFMLVRNDEVGQSFLSHLHIRTNQQSPIEITQEPLITKAYKLQSKTVLNHERIYVQEHFPLLQNVVEHIVISHGGHVDMKTQAKLHDIHIKLEKVTNRLCQL